ncbi:MAG: redoxin domain-containing protein, partial [Planctomycetes bacterium]|nr:redoxin domain-containing protein [Planctomycetota bacterium]
PGDYQRQVAELEGRLKRLRSEHNALVHTLREIHAIADREQAGETVARLNALIEDQTKEHQSQVQSMERGLGRLRSIVRRIEDRKVVNRAGGKAPKFRLKGSDGKTVRLEDFAGKIVVLEWVNPECPIAKQYYDQKIPQKLARKYHEEGVVWLGINSGRDQTAEQNRKFVETFDLDYPILEDPAGAIARLYGAKSTPHVFIIDAQGTIAYNGAVDDSVRSSRAKKKKVTHFVEDALSALVAGNTVKVPFTQPFGTPIGHRR